jgi:hypothetical protein
MALKKLIKTYLDKYGRMDLKPVNGGEPSTNNQLLYTGELAILMFAYNKHFKFADEKDVFTQSDFDGLMEGILVSKVPNYPGLFARHPDPYRLGLPLKGRPTSFDEILGAAFVAGLSAPQVAEAIVRHGERFDWQYCDVPSFEQGGEISRLFLNPVRTFAELKDYIKAANTYEKDGFRKAAQNFDWFYPLFFSHSSSSRLIYKAAAGIDYGFWLGLSVLPSIIVASIKSDNISTKVLWYFRLKFLETIGRESFGTRLAKRIYKWSETKRYGKDFEKELFKLYYKDVNHPFHQMIDYARLK